MTPRITLYGRPGCHLCDDARDHLRRLDLTFEEVDITTDDELHARYLERIPVIAVDGVEVSDFFVDEPKLLNHLSLSADELR